MQSWEADELASNSPIDDIMKRDLLGARRKILFVEGTKSSLDLPLYSLIFPQVSIIPKGNCREVEQAVQGLIAVEQFNWLKAFGIVDGDGYDAAAVAVKAGRGVYAVPYYSVEAIYFHPHVIKLIAARLAGLSGDEPGALYQAAIDVGIASVREHTDRLCANAVKKAGNMGLLEQLPRGDDLLRTVTAEISWDGEAFLNERKAELEKALDLRDWEAVLKAVSIKKCDACDRMVKALKLPSLTDYHQAVRHLLVTDGVALTFVRSLFADLHSKIAD